jgi:hypothetical protein
MLPKLAFQPLVDKVVDRLLAWKGKLLHQSDRLTLVKTTLSSIPIYIAINLELRLWLYKALQKIMMAFLWSRTEVVHNGKCLVVWDQVQRPLPLGGLGILDLWLMGVALRLRSLRLQWIEPSCPRGTMSISIDCQTRSFFRVLGRLSFGDGNAFLFWTDPWLDGSSIAELAPYLLHAVPGQRRHKTVAEALTNGS